MTLFLLLIKNKPSQKEHSMASISTLDSIKSLDVSYKTLPHLNLNTLTFQPECLRETKREAVCCLPPYRLHGKSEKNLHLRTLVHQRILFSKRSGIETNEAERKFSSRSALNKKRMDIYSLRALNTAENCFYRLSAKKQMQPNNPRKGGHASPCKVRSPANSYKA